jgi:hypothetical protein
MAMALSSRKSHIGTSGFEQSDHLAAGVKT